MPGFKYLTLPEVWSTALTLAIVASLETLLIIEAADELDPYKRVTPNDRELKAQGRRKYCFGPDRWFAGYFCYRKNVCEC
jgi:hypothetical protein